MSLFCQPPAYFLHDWAKWERYQWKLTHRDGSLSLEDRQKRCCNRCGYSQDEFLVSI